jgi:hypothetical protein
MFKIYANRFYLVISFILAFSHPCRGGIKEFCEAQFPDDYVLQKQCILNDLKYAKKVLAWMKDHGCSEGNEKNAPHYVVVIIDKCISDG